MLGFEDKAEVLVRCTNMLRKREVVRDTSFVRLNIVTICGIINLLTVTMLV